MVSEEHKQWCENITHIVKDGGTWGIPRSGLIFEFDKKNKLLILVHGDKNSTDFAATAENFAAIGWRVITKEERGAVPPPL